MPARPIETSPQLYARTAGVLYLIIIVIGIFGEAVVRERVVVSGDAVATAANLTAMEPLWRLGIAAQFLSLFCVVVLAMIYFFLLLPVSKELSVLATFFRLMSIGIEAVAAISLVAALFPLGTAVSLKAFTPEQLSALAGLAIRSHGHGFGVALLFVGCTFLIHGYLIFRSGFLPKVLGILIQVAGVSYLTNSFALLLAPAFASKIFPAILAPAFIAELALSLWLIVKGVNVPRWNERVRLGLVGAPRPMNLGVAG
jgi:hypothetical protein